MKNTQLDRELLEAIEDIEMSEYVAMVESTCSLLEMYDKQLDIIEETTVPDEMLVTEFAIFQEADDSADKKDEKEENWFVRNIGNTRFGDNAGEKQKLFGRTNKKGNKENVIVGLLLLVPRLIAGLVNIIRDKIAGGSKEERAAAAKTAEKAADAIEKGEAEVTSDGKNVTIELKTEETSENKEETSENKEETSENNEDKGAENSNPSNGGDNTSPSDGGSAKKATTQTITIPENVFKTITTFANLNPRTYSVKLKGSKGRSTTPMTEAIQMAQLHQEAFVKIREFINTYDDYMKSQWGGEKQETQIKELKDLEKEINDLNKKKLSVQSPSEAEKIEKEIERLNNKKNQYSKVSDMAFDTTGKKKNKTFSGGTYDGETVESVKKTHGGKYDTAKKSLLDSDTYSTDGNVKGLTGVVAKTREFMSKYATAKKNKNGDRKEEAVIALRFIADVNTDDQMMNEFQSYNERDLSKLNRDDVAHFAYDPDLAGILRLYSDQVKTFSKTATQVFTAYLQTQKTLVHTRLTDKGEFDKKHVGRLGVVEDDAEKILGDKYKRETAKRGKLLTNYNIKENVDEPDGYTKMKDELINDPTNPISKEVFDNRFDAIATELANWIDVHKPELIKTLSGYNMTNSYSNYTPWLKLQCDGQQYVNVIKRAIQTGENKDYNQAAGVLASHITKQTIQDIYDAANKEYQGGKKDKDINKAMEAAVKKIAGNKITKYSELIKDNNVKRQVDSIGEEVYKNLLKDRIKKIVDAYKNDPKYSALVAVLEGFDIDA